MSASNGYGLIAGNINGYKATFNNLVSVAQEGIGEYNTNGDTSNCLTVTLQEITGDAALVKIPALFEEKNEAQEYYWTTVEGGTPILALFATQEQD